MKKNLIITMVALLFIFVTVGVASCSKDDSISSEELESILMGSGWISDNEYDAYVWGDANVSFTTERTTYYFLGNGEGVARDYTYDKDSYFGSSSKNSAWSFKYTVDKSSVFIHGTNFTDEYEYRDGVLVMKGENSSLKKTSLSSSDYDWIESAKYSVMPDNERLNIDIYSELVMRAKPWQNNDGTANHYYDFYFGVKGTERADSRDICHIEATFKVTGATGYVEKEELLIQNDKDCSSYAGVNLKIKNGTQATLTVKFRIHDRKTNKMFDSKTVTYKIPHE